MKKRIISMVLAICMTITLLPAEAMAEEWESVSDKISACETDNEGNGERAEPLSDHPEQTEAVEDGQTFEEKADPYSNGEAMSYPLDNGAEITVTVSGMITGGTPGADGLIDIPSEVTSSESEGTEPQSITITAIGDGAFHNCSGLKGITIPDGVTYVGVDAFNNCTELTSIQIPNSVTMIKGFTFWGCSSLTTATLPDGITMIPESMFINCSSLTNINIPSSVVDIQAGAFSGCKVLSNISIPDSVTNIGANAFSDCTSLSSISLPDSVTSMGVNAFSDCTNLSSVNIPGGVTRIDGTFSGCHGLQSIIIPDSVTTIGDMAFYDCIGLTDIHIPGSVIAIGDNAFTGCDRLTSVTIPGKVNSIGRSSFSYCEGLEEVTLSDGVSIIGEGMFQDCTKLSKITVPASVSRIGKKAFSNCTLLRNVVIPDGVSTIEEETFYKCKSLYSITIPDSVTAIEDSAFTYCWDLPSITIPNSVKSIGFGAFFGCYDFSNVTIPDSVTAVGESAFAYCLGLISVTISSNITEISKLMFCGCEKLEGVDIPNGVIRIGDSAFKSCKALTCVDIANSVVEIGNESFRNCPNLASVVIPDSVTTIESFAFSEDNNLAKVVIPANVTTMGHYIFWGCDNITSAGPIGGDYSIQFGWTDAFPDRAFSCDGCLKSITIPDSITNLGKATFNGCSNLTSIVIPNGITRIENELFSDCFALAEITIPPSVSSIGDHAFRACSSLTNITILAGVTSIGTGAFSNCTKLTTATIYASKITIDGWNFHDSAPGFVLYCYPESDAETYAKANNVSYSLITATSRTLTVSLLDEEGGTIEKGFAVTWFDADGKQVAEDSMSLQGADVRYNYSFEIMLDDEMSALYEQPERQTISPSDPPSRQVQLVKKSAIKTLTLFGQVKGQDGMPVPGATVSITPINSSLIEASTGPDGKFTAEVPYGRVSYVIRKEDCYSKQDMLELSEEVGEAFDMGVCTLVPFQVITNQLALSVNLRQASEDPNTAIEIPLTSLDTMKVDVTGIHGPINSFDIQELTLLFQPGTVAAGEKVTVTIRDASGIYQTATASVALNEDCLGSADLTMVQKGGFILGGVSGPGANVLVFDGAGNCIQTSSAVSGLTSKAMEPGTYQLVLLQKSDLLRGISSLSYLETFGIREGRDYLKRQITIKDGQITRLADCTIPNLDESRISYTVKDHTNVTTSSPSGVTIGSLLAVRAAYELDSARNTTAENIRVLLPNGVSLLDASVSIDNQSAPYTYDAGKREVRISVSGRDKAVVWLYCTPAKSGSQSVSAALDLSSGATQPIGTAVIQVENARMEVPERIGDANGLAASGKALPGTTVMLYDNGQPVGNATANAAGSWTMPFNLAQPTYSYSYHNIHAVMTGGVLPEAITTESVLVTYDERMDVALTKITMYNTGDHGEQKTVFDFTEAKSVTPYYRMWPSRYPTFTFKAEFSGNSSDLSEVYVVTTNSAGDKTYVKMEYDSASRAWVGVHDYTSFHDAPAKVTAAYHYGFTGEIPFDEEVLEAATDSFLDTSKELLAALDAEFHDAYSCTEPTIDGNSLSTKITYTDPASHTTEEFGAYYLDAVPLGDDVTEKTLADDGFFFMDGSKLWSKIEFGDSSITRILVDMDDRICLTEKTVFDAEQTRLATADDAMSLVNYDFLWGIFDDWNPGVPHYTIVKMLQFIPGYGLAATLTEGLAKTYEAQAIWRTRLNGNVSTLQTDLNTVLYGILEARCKNSGMRRVPDNVYTSMRMALLFMPEEIAEYEKEARELINGAMVSNLAWYAILSVMAKCSANLSKGIESGTLGVETELLDRILKMALDGVAYGSTVGDVVNDLMRELSLVKSGVDHYINGRNNEFRKRLNNLSESIKASYISCDDPSEELSEALLKSEMQQPASRPVTYIADPSGYVYEAVPSNRLSGVTATISSQTGGIWNAADYDQINPQMTGADGAFYWDVPQGNWKVSLSKDGYIPADTSNVDAAVGGWLPVPPPQLDIYVGMTSTAAPTVKQITAYTEQIILEFSQYMDISSVQNAVALTRDGEVVTAVTITPLDSEYNREGTTQYATRFAILPDDGDLSGDLKLSIGTGTTNYAGKNLQSTYTSSALTAAVQPMSIDVPDDASTELHGTVAIDVTLQPNIAGRKLAIDNLSPALLSVGTSITTGPDGSAKITVTGTLPGSGLFQITEPVSGLSKTVMIHVSVTGAVSTAPEKPTASLEGGKVVTSGMTVEQGAKIVLRTPTPGAVIRYTLNDTCPCENTALDYTGPISITRDTILRAAAYKDGLFSSTICLEIKVKTSGGSDPLPPTPPTPPSPPASGTITITFNANGGTVAPLTMATNADGKLISLPVPAREGYIFDGWFTTPSGGRKVTETEQYTGDTVLYAHWRQNETPPSAIICMVTFDGNGGISTTEMLTTNKDGTLSSLPAATREGYAFEGWFTASVGGRKVTESERYTSDTTLYAHWKQNVAPPASSTYKVTFDGNGGTSTITTLTTDKQGRLSYLPTAVRSGYTFDGWFTSSAGGRKVTESTQYAGDTTLYAHWTRKGGHDDNNHSGSSGGGSSSSSRRYTVAVSKATGGHVSASPTQASAGTQVTVTVRPESSYELDTLEAIRSGGNKIVLAKKNDTRYTFIMPSSNVDVLATFKPVGEEEKITQTFPDVLSGYWAVDEISWVYEAGLMRGTGNGLFNPDGTITRQQLWMILARSAGENPASMTEAKGWAMSNGLSDGTRPGEPVTRQQLAAMLYRYVKLNGDDFTTTADLTAYPDRDSISGYAKVPLAWAVSNGIINGTNKGQLNPNGCATRAQFAVIMYRFCHVGE